MDATCEMSKLRRRSAANAYRALYCHNALPSPQTLSKMDDKNTYIVILATKRHAIFTLDIKLGIAISVKRMKMRTPVDILDLVRQLEKLLLERVELLRFFNNLLA